MDNKFIFEKENKEKIECELLASFHVDSLKKEFIIFTDNKKDESGNYIAYQYYQNDNDETLYPVTDENELKLVDDVFNKIKEGKTNNE